MWRGEDHEKVKQSADTNAHSTSLVQEVGATSAEPRKTVSF
jgi:hypothetical protein